MRATLNLCFSRTFRVLPLALGVALLAGCGGDSAPRPEPASNGPVRGQYAFWPQAPDAPRVQFIKSFKSNEDVSQRQASGFEKLVFGREAEATDLVNKPYGVAMKDGKIYVCDIRNACVIAIDLNKRQSRIIGSSGSNPLKHPVAAAIADDGEIYIADNERGAIFVYDQQERYSRLFGMEKFKPAGIAVHGDRLYASNTASQVVEVFNRITGDRIGSIGTVGDEDGQFRLPLGIATDSKGNLWVADMMRCRVQKFGPDGKFISGLGTLGDYRGSFARPKHIAVDSDNILYVVDAAFQNVQMFDDQGRPLMHFGAGGAFPGAMNLPAGICISEESVGVVAGGVHPGFKPSRVVVVTNQFGGDKVSMYAMGQLRDGYSVKDISAAAYKVNTGTEASPSKERLKLQSPGDEEPLPTPSGGEAPKSDPKATPAAP